jgi:hypothetical protein
LIVIYLLTGGTEKGPSFSYSLRRDSWSALLVLGLLAILVFGNVAFFAEQRDVRSLPWVVAAVIALLVGLAYLGYNLPREILRFRSTVLSADSVGIKVPHIPSRIEWSEIGEVSIEEDENTRYLIVRLRDAETFIARRIGLVSESATRRIRMGAPLVHLNAAEVNQDIDEAASWLRQLAESASAERT